MPALHRMREISRRFGIDVARYPRTAPEYGAFRALVSPDPDVILDVGANDGGFARQARRFGFRSLLVSFEPGNSAFKRLQHAARKDPKWLVYDLALGQRDERTVLNIAGNDGASSSVLPMLPAHTDAAPGSAYVAHETVRMLRLDDWYAQQNASWARPALKIDVQGFERHVLEGASRVLDEIVAIHLELSLERLYAGSWLWDEAVEWLTSHRFALAAVSPGFSDPRSGRMLQFDGVFLRAG